MIKYLKERLCFILFGILGIIVLSIVVNATLDGIGRIITQNQIDDSYRINK